MSCLTVWVRRQRWSEGGEGGKDVGREVREGEGGGGRKSWNGGGGGGRDWLRGDDVRRPGHKLRRLPPLCNGRGGIRRGREGIAPVCLVTVRPTNERLSKDGLSKSDNSANDMFRLSGVGARVMQLFRELEGYADFANATPSLDELSRISGRIFGASVRNGNLGRGKECTALVEL